MMDSKRKEERGEEGLFNHCKPICVRKNIIELNKIKEHPGTSANIKKMNIFVECFLRI